jgi:hypothetical protein
MRHRRLQRHKLQRLESTIILLLVGNAISSAATTFKKPMHLRDMLPLGRECDIVGCNRWWLVWLVLFIAVISKLAPFTLSPSFTLFPY